MCSQHPSPHELMSNPHLNKRDDSGILEDGGPTAEERSFELVTVSAAGTLERKPHELDIDMSINPIYSLSALGDDIQNV